METKDIIVELRTKKGLSQEALAEKVFVTRQAVSRWETGETVPNTETLKLLSKLFDVSINTLLGSPRQLICQCCGMPLEDSNISKETDGFFNEEYCKWCYADGEYMYHDILGFIYKKKLISLHTVMNKITGLLLFLLPPALQFIEPRCSFAVVCIIATIAAIQEFCYIIKANDK